MEKSMEDCAKVADNERLSEKADELTAENKRCFLGVLEALDFVQNVQKQTGAEQPAENANHSV
jgi:hypothetical protein